MTADDRKTFLFRFRFIVQGTAEHKSIMANKFCAQSAKITNFNISATDDALIQEQIHSYLPSDTYKYKFLEVNVSGASEFICTFRVNLCDESSVNKWLSEFFALTKTNFIVKSSKVCRSESICHCHYVVSKHLLCQHSSRRKVDDSRKDKECKASLSIRTKKQNKFTRYRDPYVKDGLPTEVQINFVHSHALKNAEAWSWLKRSSETKDCFLQYFSDGMCPADAMRYHKALLMADDIDMLADSSRNPPPHWVYVLHNAWKRNHFGELTPGPDFFRLAEERRIKLLNEGHMVSLHANPFVLCIVTPIMQRTLRSLSIKESFFLDTSSSCDQTNSALTIVSVATKAGAVPVGVFIHESQDENNYTTALQHLKTLWREIKTPLIENFMTDDSSSLKNALHTVWPEVRQLLCQFHVLQALWRWLWDGKHMIQKDDRKPLMSLFRNIMYATTDSDAEIAFQQLSNETSKSYSNFFHHVSSLYKRRNEWCTAHRTGVHTRNNDTNNYAEATFRIVKDIMLTRLKAYNPIALLDYITVILEKYYSLRLLDAAFGRLKKPYLIFQRYQDKGMTIVHSNPEAVQQVSLHSFYVKSLQDSAVTYCVESDIGTCSCRVGSRGAFCKHQAAVHIKFGHCFPNCPKLISSDKFMLYKIAVGAAGETNDSFFASMMEAENVPTSSTENSMLHVTQTSTEAHEESTLLQCDTFVYDTSEFNAELDRMKELLSSNATDSGLMKAASKFFHRLKKVQTPMQLYQFMSQGNIGNGRKKIKVQPTSISRRREGATRGCGHQRSGRPPRELKVRALKRIHSLSVNVEGNQPNAKGHGSGH